MIVPIMSTIADVGSAVCSSGPNGPSFIEEVALRRELPPPVLCAAIRKSAGVSLRRLATAIGVSPQTLLNWERASSQPRARYLAAYIAALRSLREQIEANDEP